MRQINDGDTIREYNTRDLIELFQSEILDIHKSDVDDWEADLMFAQYAYVKFGLLLERVRNQCWWNRCQEKFADFRAFCQTKINLNIWQVLNAIKSATVAVRLSQLGFEQFPRNASQALKLADLPVERLAQVWGNVLASCEGHKITALAIESQINPDKVATSSTLKLPAAVVDGLRRQAIERGLTLNEYLERLANGEDFDEGHVAESGIVLAPEDIAAIDALEVTFKQAPPKKQISTILDRFDDLMNNLVGELMPHPGRVPRVT